MNDEDRSFDSKENLISECIQAGEEGIMYIPEYLVVNASECHQTSNLVSRNKVIAGKDPGVCGKVMVQP